METHSLNSFIKSEIPEENDDVESDYAQAQYEQKLLDDENMFQMGD
jgi:hypothetical protein